MAADTLEVSNHTDINGVELRGFLSMLEVGRAHLQRPCRQPTLGLDQHNGRLSLPLKYLTWVDNESGFYLLVLLFQYRGAPSGIVMVIRGLCTVTTFLPLSFEAEA